MEVITESQTLEKKVIISLYKEYTTSYIKEQNFIKNKLNNINQMENRMK